MELVSLSLIKQPGSMATVKTRANAAEQALLEHILADCRTHRISVKFQSKRTLGSAKYESTGYFDGTKIAVAHRSKNWFEALVHEWCHLQQKLDGEWFSGPTADWAFLTFDRWIEGKSEPTQQRLLECTRLIQLCELDCERRVVETAKRWNLPWDFEWYVQRSNIVLLTYECSRLTRKWDSRRVPSRVKELQALVPTQFIRRDRLGCLPEGFLDIWLRKCATK